MHSRGEMIQTIRTESSFWLTKHIYHVRQRPEIRAGGSQSGHTHALERIVECDLG
jgi:hypothetical protein